MNGIWYCIRGGDKFRVIDELEVGTTQKFLQVGWNVASMQEYWRDHNFLDLESTSTKCTHRVNESDPSDRESFKLCFRSSDPYTNPGNLHLDCIGFHSLDPYTPYNAPTDGGFRNLPLEEVIMFKTNRTVSEAWLKELTSAGRVHYSELVAAGRISGYSSDLACEYTRYKGRADKDGVKALSSQFETSVLFFSGWASTLFGGVNRYLSWISSTDIRRRARAPCAGLSRTGEGRAR